MRFSLLLAAVATFASAQNVTIYGVAPTGAQAAGASDLLGNVSVIASTSGTLVYAATLTTNGAAIPATFTQVADQH